MPKYDHLLVLEEELQSADGSFALELRCNLYWNKAAFVRLVSAMQEYLETRPKSETLERWIAEGFWHMEHFVKDVSTHVAFRRAYEPQYYDDAYERLHALSHWLFIGESPYLGGSMAPFNS